MAFCVCVHLFLRALVSRLCSIGPKGRTPLHLAVEQAHSSPNHLQCMFLLVELGGATLGDVADNDGATALHLAAEKGAAQTASLLIHTGVKVDCADHDGLTPLQLGARNGQLGVVQALINAGATLSHVDYDGSTALAHASAQGHMGIVEALLSAGADPSVSDLLSDSPLKIAIRHGHLDVSCLLIRQEEAVDLRACGVNSCEWLTSLCSHAQAAMSMNLSANSIRDEAAVGVLSAVSVSMTKLVVLDLSKNKLEVALDMPRDVLQHLSRLSSLSLAHNSLADLHSNVSAFIGLVSLDVSNNLLKILPSALGCCTLMQRLNCSHNKMPALPECVCKLTKLVVLNVANNDLKCLPQAMSTLRNLQMLQASGNKLETLPPLPTSLLSVWLDRNRLVEIPPQLGDATGLEALHLGDNMLQNLPPTLVRTALRQSRGLHVLANPLSCIPDHLRDSPDGILGFLEDVHEGLEQVLFIRVMVMGDEGAGKTSLVRCLHDPDLSLKALLRQPRLPDTGGSTLGVEAAKADTVCNALGAKVAIQFWDLAGQACYLVGHSLLMSDRVLPLYVMDTSVVLQTSLDAALKWLDTLMLALPPVPHSPLTAPLPATATATPPQTSEKRPRSVSLGGGTENGVPEFGTLPPRPSLDGSEIAQDLDYECTPESHAPADGAGDAACSDAVVSIVIIGTKVEAGSCEREEAIAKLQAVSQSMIQRTKKLHGRRLCVRAIMGVSHSTREGFDARTRVSMNFKQVLQRIAEAALGVLYTDRKEQPFKCRSLRTAILTRKTTMKLTL